MLRAKFKVDGVKKEDNGRSLQLSACVDESGDNQDWSKWTPSGQLQMFISNENAFPKIDALKPGDLFYVDLTPLEKQPS